MPSTHGALGGEREVARGVQDCDMFRACGEVVRQHAMAPEHNNPLRFPISPIIPK